MEENRRGEPLPSRELEMVRGAGAAQLADDQGLSRM